MPRRSATRCWSRHGQLNPKMYGPGFYPKLSQEVLATQSMPGDGWGSRRRRSSARRSIYIHVKRSLVLPLLAAFDFPDIDSSCEARFVTTQPAQALAMLNGEFVNEQAGKLAERVHERGGRRAASASGRGACAWCWGASRRRKRSPTGWQLIEALHARARPDRRTKPCAIGA